MREGLLWYDNDPKKALPAKVAEAAQAYQRKFGRRPPVRLAVRSGTGAVLHGDACYVAPETSTRDAHKVSLRLVPSPLVRPHHFWVGVDERQHTAAV
jgi:hypothetical protein